MIYFTVYNLKLNKIIWLNKALHKCLLTVYLTDSAQNEVHVSENNKNAIVFYTTWTVSQQDGRAVLEELLVNEAS